MKKLYSAFGVAMLWLAIILGVTSSAYAESISASKVDRTFGGNNPIVPSAAHNSSIREIQNAAQFILKTLSKDKKEHFVIPENIQLLQADNPDEPLELILILRRKGKIISPGIVALVKNEKIYLPLTEIANTIKFKTTPNIKAGFLEGYFFSQDNTFYIDTVNNKYSVRGQINELPEESVIVSDFGNGLGEFYVESLFLNKLWKLKLETNFSDLSVSITTPAKLPEELAAYRSQTRRIKEGKKDLKTEGLTYLPNNYKAFSKPHFDLSSEISYDQKRDKKSTQLFLRGANDLLGAKADYAFNFSYDKENAFSIDSNRFLFSRKSDHPYGLPLGLTEIELGDVITSPPEHVLSYAEGRGVKISNLPLRRLKEFDEIDISGQSRPGWEVEVYNGNNLVGYTIVEDDGSYRIPDIPLYYGSNKISTVIYGPEGQKEEKTEVVSVNRQMLQPGKTALEAAVFDNNKDFLPISDAAENQKGSFFGELYVARGINNNISAFSTLTNLELNNEQKTYLTAGTDLAILNGTGKVELYRELGGGFAFDTKYSSRFKDINFNLEGTYFSDFESQKAGYGDNRKTFQGNVRAIKFIQSKKANYSLSGGISRLHRERGSKSTLFDFAQSATYNFKKDEGLLGIKSLRLSNSNTARYENGKHRGTFGRANLDTQLNKNWDLRTNLTYDVSPELKAKSIRFNLGYKDFDRFSSNLFLTRDIQDPGTELGFRAAYKFDDFTSGLEFLHDFDEGYDIALRASTSLSPSGKDGSYRLSSTIPSGFTSVSANLFFDNNLNGKFDENDKPFEGASLFVGSRKIGPSDSNGYIAPEKVKGNGAYPVYIDPRTTPNPYVVTVDEGYFTDLRPDSELILNIPVIETGIIDGHIRFSNGTPAANVRVQLINNEGRLISETSTIFDGFYTFEYVKPGEYIVQLDPSYEFSVPPVGIRVTSTDLFLYGTNLIVMEQAKEVQASANAEEREHGIVPTNHNPLATGTEMPAPSTLSNRFPVAVNHVWTGELMDKGHLVLMLSGPADYKVTHDRINQEVIIDFENVEWNAANSWGSSFMPYVASYKANLIDPINPQLIVRVKNQVELKSHKITSPTEPGQAYKLELDFSNN